VSLEQILEWEDGVNHANHDDDTHRVKDMIDVASRGKLRARAYAGGSNFDAYRKVIDKGNLLLAGVIEAGTDSIKGGNIRGMDAYEHFIAGVGHDKEKVIVACSSWRELQNRPDVGFFSLEWERFLKIWRWSDSGIIPKDGVNRLEVEGWTEHLGLVVSRV
jgi:hypothetical protein